MNLTIFLLGHSVATRSSYSKAPVDVTADASVQKIGLSGDKTRLETSTALVMEKMQRSRFVDIVEDIPRN